MHNKRRELIFLINAGLCQICKKPLGADWQGHHAGEHDTKGSNKKHPLYTQSIINILPVHQKCHLENPSWGKISDIQAERWQIFLQTWVDLCQTNKNINFELVVNELEFLKVCKSVCKAETPKE